MAITERIPIPLSTMKKVALDNARQAAPDAKIILEENRQVNGLHVTCLKIVGTVQGIPFTYFGYYHSGSKGTIQLLTYTANTLFAEYQDDFTDFLSGLTAK